MAKIAQLHENAKVALRNITVFWWDYKGKHFVCCVIATTVSAV